MPGEISTRPENQPDHRFAATRWSMVAGLKMGEEERQRCLGELCRLYYYPVYAHIRHCGHGESEAYQLTRAFLGWVLESVDEARPSGRFRVFLLNRLEQFLKAPQSGTGVVFIDAPSSSELAARYQSESESGRPGSFDAGYAREILANSLRQLRREADVNGRGDLHEKLAGFLAREPTSAEYRTLAEQLDMSKIGLVVALRRLRVRFNELVTTELSDTVDNPEDLDRERAVLFDVLKSGKS